VTQLLVAWTDGNRAALEERIPEVYPELRRIAGRYLRRERVGHTLQPTALVHEACVKLIGQDRARWQNRAVLRGCRAADATDPRGPRARTRGGQTRGRRQTGHARRRHGGVA
jgi:hypothetical protein